MKNKVGAPPKTNEEFLNRIAELNNGIEIIGEYEGYHKPILFRNKYGICKVEPGTLLKGMLGSLRSAVDKTSYMIEQFKEKHGSFYSYPNYNYCGNRCEGLILCPIHGEFKQLTDVHLMGSGCRDCAFINNPKYEGRGYSRIDYINRAAGRDCTLYLIKCLDDKEKFYKIGITVQSTRERFSSKNSMPYNYEILQEYKCDAGCVWDLEKELHKEYKSYRYLPNNTFKGITECFNLSLPIDEIIENLKNIV